jgi:hypothetical protein
MGVWGKDEESESSNFKAFENVVLTIEEEARNGSLNGAMMCLFTDNSTVEGALYRGNNPSRKLFNLIIRFRKIQMACDAEIVMSHVAGTRMSAQGTDGVSCGLVNEGVATGLEMLSFVPLHLSAIQRNTVLIAWVSLWLGEDAEFLTTEQWFTRGHSHDGGFYDKCGFWRVNTRPGKFVWSPAPAVADVAVEEMQKALLKRRDCTHVFLCP